MYDLSFLFNVRNNEKTRLLGREVIKLITPGTLVEPLNNHANYLLCLVPGPSSIVGLAWVDVSTAEFLVTSSEVGNIEEDLERICPSEVKQMIYDQDKNNCNGNMFLCRFSFQRMSHR